MASLYSAVNTRRDGRGAGSGCWSPDESRDCFSDGVDTRTRISDPTLGQEPPLTRGVSCQSDQEGSERARRGAARRAYLRPRTRSTSSSRHDAGRRAEPDRLLRRGCGNLLAACPLAGATLPRWCNGLHDDRDAGPDCRHFSSWEEQVPLILEDAQEMGRGWVAARARGREPWPGRPRGCLADLVRQERDQSGLALD
jgi:hypothetical protein